jgi:hypothetical protein
MPTVTKVKQLESVFAAVHCANLNTRSIVPVPSKRKSMPFGDGKACSKGKKPLRGDGAYRK